MRVGKGFRQQPGDAPKPAADFQEPAHWQPACAQNLEQEPFLKQMKFMSQALPDVALAAFQPVLINVEGLAHGFDLVEWRRAALP